MEEQIDYEERASLLKALSNPIRLQIVHGLLISGCHNVGCMEASTGMSQSLHLPASAEAAGGQCGDGGTVRK